MIRRSVGSRSAVKGDERLSFLDKAAAVPQIVNSFDIGKQVPPVKKVNQASKLVQQVLQARYNTQNGGENQPLTKIAGVSLFERKATNTSKQTNFSLPPTSGSTHGQLSVIQQNQLRRRHGEGSYGGAGTSKMDFGINGESLQIKLTGTSLMNRNVQRDSYSYPSKELKVNDSVVGEANLGTTIGSYHPKIRARLESTGNKNYNVTPNTGAPHLSNAHQQQQQFAQQMIEVQMHSPRTGSHIF